MIRIVHLITALGRGGAEWQLKQFVMTSSRSGFEHYIVSMTPFDSLACEPLPGSIDLRSLNMQRGVPGPDGLLRLMKLLRRWRPQILHCWMYHANLLGMLAGKLVRVPYVLWSIHGSNIDFQHYRPTTRWVVWLGACLCRHCDAIIFNSQAGRDVHVRWGYGHSKMLVVPNGFDLNLFKPDPVARRSVRDELGLSENALLIGLVARFDPMKDHANFFRAAWLVNQSHPDVHFLLIGDGLTSENPLVSQMVSEGGLERQVHLLGGRKDVARLTAALDVASSSSSGEGFSNAIGEAMSCGIPCVVTDVGDSKWIVGDTGSVVPPRDPEALAQACLSLVEMCPTKRQELGRAARKRVEENFALVKKVRSYESLYRATASHADGQTIYSVAS